MSNSGVSLAAPIRVRKPPTDKTYVVSMHKRVLTNWVSGRMLQPSIKLVITNSTEASYFLVEGQISGQGTVHPLLTSFSQLHQHMVSTSSDEEDIICNGCTPKEREEKDIIMLKMKKT